VSAQPKPASVLIVGSGPVIIGQAAEFDYAGTQACRALRDEGVRTILLNSNPATIMTDPGVADAVYLEPITVASVERILERETVDGILCGLGGQTALNLAVALDRAGVLERHGVRLLGTPLAAIEMAEDRQRFRELLDSIGQPYPASEIVEGTTPRERQERARRALETIGLPAVIRPAYTLGGSGGGIVATEAEYLERVRSGLRAAPSARSLSSATSTAGRRSSTRSCATQRTRASPCARWRTSTRWACTPATRSWSRRCRR
jgi:carbamoyl-phosphate synthase large subunit